MSNPNPGQHPGSTANTTYTYSALCPWCGAAVYRPVGGTYVDTCDSCQQSASFTFHYLPGGQGNQGAGFLSHVAHVGGVGVGVGGLTFPTLATMTPDPTDTTLPDPLAVRREAARRALYSLASDVNDFLRTLPSDWWDLPQWRRYNHLQEAHEQLFEALGGTRMGAYRPPSAAVRAALSEALLWMLLLLDGAEQRPTAKGGK